MNTELKVGTASARYKFVPLLVLAVITISLCALLPAFTRDQPFVVVLASHALIAAMVAVSLDALTGNTGLLSFGHAGWFGLGGYVTGLLSKSVTTEMLLLLPITALLVMVLSFLFGQIFMRQVGKAFAILTLAFSQVLYALVFVLSRITGGEDGLQGIPSPTLLGMKVAGPQVWYWLLLAFLVGFLVLVLYLRITPLGKAWLGVRENAERATFVGLNVFRLKVTAYVISAMLASVAGGLFVLFNGAISPESLHWFESGKMLMYVVLGGVGTIVGPAVGAVVFTLAENYISSVTNSWLVYFGALFVFIVIVAPGGIFGLLKPHWQRMTSGGGSAS
ncbi:branched-chain amino acid ABC transporter permease [Polaromonas sp.]|uniref:branched-chain amino acid ABC transporter permease n=1 Tax=Polaromonas sp. TaxID=1869339 RepID=UPI003BACF344